VPIDAGGTVVRKVSLLAALVALFVLGLGGFVPAGAGFSGTTMIVKKVVTGTATAGSTVEVDCGIPLSGDSATLTFDKNGAPDTTNNNAWMKSNGGWILHDDFGNSRSTCDFEETATGGATSTSWTCAFDFTEFNQVGDQQVEPGCDTGGSGTGTGPVSVIYFMDEEVVNQTSTVIFTNTFAAVTTTTTTTTTPTTTTTAPAAVAASPTFTG